MTLHLPMPEEWIVRVSGKEYGPVDLDTLTQWKREGRLLPSNEVRQETESEWTTASNIPDLFAPPPPKSGHAFARRRTFWEIIRDSFRIYRAAFLPFFLITLLVAVPTLAFELTSPAYGIFHRATNAAGLTPANIVGLVALVLVIVNWPIFLAGIQIASIAVLEGGTVRTAELFRRAANYFPRFARLGLIVYGSYFLWTALPVLAILSLLAASPSIPVILLALILLAIQVMMVARLFVNFLFWQQAAVVSNREGTAAIRESKMLARSRRRSRKIDRPLWRGALLASIWLLLVLCLSSGAELPFVLSKLQNVSTPEQMLAILQSLDAPQAPDGMLIASAIVAGLFHALIRPLFGIAFVLLYFDARADFSEAELAQCDE